MTDHLQGVKDWIKKHFNGFEKETWYPVVVAIADGYAKTIPQQDIKKDLNFLKEMQVLSQSLIKGRYDVAKLEQLDGMVCDWIHDLKEQQKKKKKAPPQVDPLEFGKWCMNLSKYNQLKHKTNKFGAYKYSKPYSMEELLRKFIKQHQKA